MVILVSPPEMEWGVYIPLNSNLLVARFQAQNLGSFGANNGYNETLSPFGRIFILAFIKPCPSAGEQNEGNGQRIRRIWMPY